MDCDMAWNLVNSCDDVASRMSREIDSGVPI